MGKAFRSVINSTGMQLWVSHSEVLPGLLTGEAEGAGFIHPGEEEADGDLFAVCHYPEGAYRQDGAWLFSERHRESARGNSHDLQQGRFLLSIRKSLSPGHVSALAWVPQEAEGSPSLEVLRRHLDKALSNLN